MATYTTNLNLKKPAKDDKIRVSDLNENAEIIDAAVGYVGNGSLVDYISALQGSLGVLAYGDIHDAISKGQFVFVKSNAHSLDDGLYVASTDVAQDGAVSSANMTAISAGGFNTPARFIRELASNTDLDTLYEAGWYTTANSGTYVNTPVPNDNEGQRVVMILPSSASPGASTFKHMLYANKSFGIYGHRVMAGGTWSAWNVYGTNMLSESFTPASISSQGNYQTGKTLRIASYNVAEYDNDTSTKIQDNRILNFRKFIAQAKLDFLMTQEEPQYIDDGNTKGCIAWLFRPVMEEYYSSGVWGNIIHCHTLAVSGGSGKVGYSTIKTGSRCIGYAVFQIDTNTRLLLMTTHCVWKNFDPDPESAVSIAARLQNYRDMFQWANGSITLPKYSDDTAVTVPAHTHTIICMDANCITDEDKTNMQTEAANNNFILGNGGRFGWFKTCFDKNGQYALDQIAVSNNIIINDIEPQVNWFSRLYSDHVPVIAEVTLM